MIEPTPEGVQVVVPVVPEHCARDQSDDAVRELVDALVTRLPRHRLLLWFYTPMALPISKNIAADLCVYDNMDELSLFRGASPLLIDLERRLLERADIVFTGGLSLYEAKRDRHSNIHAFPSSIDVTHFGKARSARIPQPADQAAVGQPRFGFFGVIDERMDLQLIERMAQLKPEWHFIMIGPVVKIDPGSLPRLPNLFWLGEKKYDELPAYLAGWDIGIMPFALNESTRFISPTKTPEYLAAGVPVISTPIRDVVRPYGELKLVEIAADAEGFVAKGTALLERERKPWLARVDSHLATMSWDDTWQSMRQLMDVTRSSKSLATTNHPGEAYV